MFVVKVLIGVACVYFCCKISSNKAEGLKESYLFWDSAVDLCNYLLQELTYKKRPLEVLLDKKFISSDFKSVLDLYLTKNKFEFPPYITDIEKSKMISFLSALGKSDSESQKISINANKIDFESISLQKKLEFKKSYSIILKVGFSMGIMLFIMVI